MQFFPNFFLAEPDSYPNREKPISTREALLRRNVAERRRRRREESMKNADLINFFIIITFFAT